ncbi:unnamed protein product [Phyllotreta striolata]|uniref:Uncharacterized protein n=1 Tax=Phyllotreta striolata TaxID=444603 RepID=A0A9N9XPQ2_PHYSR|nr:unnamed protein product [Phyllotreta striolata]
METQKHHVSTFKNENSNYCNVPEEPIDLTVAPTDLTYGNKSFAAFHNEHVKFINRKIISPVDAQSYQMVNCALEKKKKKKLVYMNVGKLVLVTDNLTSQDFTQAKQVEILKAAKSLFSKRTRTLYHWMYPTASKQQIKTTVMTSWDSLAESEKAFYISQVLGRFGLSQSNLMVNPQLDAIKEPPPLAERLVRSTKSRELQSAISSISPGAESAPAGANSLTFEEFEAINEMTRKRRGRPKGKNLIKRAKQSSDDFHDDPELSQELEKFAVKFNLNRFC